MLKSLKLAKEIVVTMANKVGVLADITKLISAAGLNVDAVAGYIKDNKSDAEIMLVVGDSAAAKDLLIKGNYRNLKEKEVIVIELENKPGALKGVADKLVAKGVDIHYIYGTTCTGASPARLVLSTSDNKMAQEALK